MSEVETLIIIYGIGFITYSLYLLFFYASIYFLDKT